MTQIYTDKARETDPHALPNAEVFWDGPDIPKYGGEPRNYDSEGNPVQEGWYWWPCFPGCLPDGDPIGPFETEQAATDNAQFHIVVLHDVWSPE
jgi:hypothetical protein